MYGGKQISVGDIIYIFASENDGGSGLIARGLVSSVRTIPKPADAGRHTPRVSIIVERTATTSSRLGRSELKHFDQWQDGQPQSELNFKLYRQATNKIVAISDGAAAFLEARMD